MVTIVTKKHLASHFSAVHASSCINSLTNIIIVKPQSLFLNNYYFKSIIFLVVSLKYIAWSNKQYLLFSKKATILGWIQDFFLGGGALISCSTSTPMNHIVFFFFLQNTSCIRKPQVISGGRGGWAPPAPAR